MPKITSVALLIVGTFLLVYGVNATSSVSSSLNQAVSGAPPDKTIWLIVLGVIGVISGGIGAFRKSS